MDREYIGFVGTTSTNGSQGVYRIAMNAQTGQIRVTDVRPAYNSGYLGLSEDKKNLYILSEGMTFQGKASGGITAYNVADGAFQVQNSAVTDGQRPCFVTCDDRAGEIYVGNFFNGTLCVYERLEDGSLGRRKAYLRHEKLGPFGPGIHCVAKAPGTPYLASLELSGDCVYIYDCLDQYRIICRASLPARSGPRHMVFSADGRFLYVNRQGDEKVSVFRFAPQEQEMLQEIQAISIRDEVMAGRTEPAAIRLCPGRNLLAVSNRGCGSKDREDSVTLFRIHPENGTLQRIQVVRTGGQMPRDMNFTPDGKFLVVCYQFQGYLDVYRLDEDGEQLRYVGRGPDIPSPVCIAF